MAQDFVALFDQMKALKRELDVLKDSANGDIQTHVDTSNFEKKF